MREGEELVGSNGMEGVKEGVGGDTLVVFGQFVSQTSAVRE